MTSKTNQVETIGPGVTIAIAEQISLILPKTPLPVSVRNSSSNCRVKVASQVGGNVITGDWTTTSENEVDPGKELVVPVSDQPQFRSRVLITNLCNSESAEVIYSVG